MTRIAISAIGVVAPGAIGIDRFASLLDSGKSAVAPVDRFDTTAFRSKNAALVRDFVPKEFIPPMKLRRMNTLSRLGVSAARLATADRGAPLPDSAGVAMGTAFGPVQTSVDYMQEYVEKGAALAPPIASAVRAACAMVRLTIVTRCTPCDFMCIAVSLPISPAPTTRTLRPLRSPKIFRASATAA